MKYFSQQIVELYTRVILNNALSQLFQQPIQVDHFRVTFSSEMSINQQPSMPCSQSLSLLHPATNKDTPSNATLPLDLSMATSRFIDKSINEADHQTDLHRLLSVINDNDDIKTTSNAIINDGNAVASNHDTSSGDVMEGIGLSSFSSPSPSSSVQLSFREDVQQTFPDDICLVLQQLILNQYLQQVQQKINVMEANNGHVTTAATIKSDNNNTNVQHSTNQRQQKKRINSNSNNSNGSVSNRKSRNPYKKQICNQCGIQCNNLRELARHNLTMHGGIRCHQCNKSFTQHSNLNRHLLIHWKKKPVHCMLCQKTYSRKDHCAKHIREVHGLENYQRHILSDADVERQQRRDNAITRKSFSTSAKDDILPSMTVANRSETESSEVVLTAFPSSPIIDII